MQIPDTTEYLVRFEAAAGDHGFSPAFYHLCRSDEDLRLALASGGTDVTHSDHAWRAYARSIDAAYQSLL